MQVMTTVKVLVKSPRAPVVADNGSACCSTIQYNFRMLPTLPDSSGPGRQTTLHLLGRFDNPHTGAERSLPDLVASLRGRRETMLWSDVPVHPHFAAMGVRALRPQEGDFPRGGTLLIGGVHVELGGWLEQARLERVLLRYNLPNHQRLFESITRIRDATGIEPELVFVSKAMQLSVGLPGRVEPSLIRIERFLGARTARPTGTPVTVGRVSRDVIGKHDPQDVAVYRNLAARGVRVRVMGGTCLAPWLASVPGVELLAAGTEDVVDFLCSLDIFFYRTGSFIEPYGRVVLEAMAAALPVVVAANGGFAEQITSAVDGYLVQTQEQALQVLGGLVGNPELRLQIGQAARNTAMSLHGAQAVAMLVENYLERA